MLFTAPVEVVSTSMAVWEPVCTSWIRWMVASRLVGVVEMAAYLVISASISAAFSSSKSGSSAYSDRYPSIYRISSSDKGFGLISSLI